MDEAKRAVTSTGGFLAINFAGKVTDGPINRRKVICLSLLRANQPEPEQRRNKMIADRQLSARNSANHDRLTTRS